MSGSPASPPDQSDLVLFLGAGASSASGLPTFNQLREALVEQAKLWQVIPPKQLEKVSNRITQLAPEVFMSCLGGTVPARERWLTTVLSGGTPSPAHRLTAQCLRAGATVWTPNADELIEVSYRDLYGADPAAASWPSDPGPDVRLLKPHGSVTTCRFLFTSEQVVRPLAAPWAARLHTDLTGRDLIVYGYAGADLDFRPVIADAMSAARSIRWICPEWEVEQLSQRYPVLRRDPRSFVAASTYGGLPPLFEVMLAERGVVADHVGRVDPDAVDRTDLFDRPPPPVTDAPIPEPELFRARLLLHLGEHKLAAPALRKAALRSDPRVLPQIGRALLTEGLYTRSMPAAARTLDAFANQPRLPLPSRARSRVLRAATTLHGFYDRDYEWVRDSLPREVSEPGALNARALAHRYLGDADLGMTDARAAFATAQATGQPDVAANAAFQMCYLTSWAGRSTEFEQWLQQLYNRMDALTSVRWLGWAHFQQARSAVHAGDIDTAEEALTEAKDLLTADGTPDGRLSCEVLHLTLLRLRGDPDGHRQLVEDIRVSLLDGALAPTQRSSVQLEIAERLRRWPEPGQDAGTLYEDVADAASTRPFFLTWALAGRAVSSHDPRAAADFFDAARTVSRHAGFGGATAEIERLATESDSAWWLTP